MLKFPAQQLNRVQHQLEPEVAHFEHTHVGLGIAHLETEPVLFVFKTPVTEIQSSVTLNFNFRFVTAGSDEADYSFHDLNLRCEPLETEYDDYMTYRPFCSSRGGLLQLRKDRSAKVDCRKRA